MARPKRTRSQTAAWTESAAVTARSRAASGSSTRDAIARGPRAIWQRLDPGWKLALVLLVVGRVLLGLVALIAAETSDRDLGGAWGQLLIRGGEPWSLLPSSWQRGDVLWYQRIAQFGYQPGDESANFYPLYPLLARGINSALGGHIVVAELLVSSVSFVIAMWLLFRLIAAETASKAEAATQPRPRNTRLAERHVSLVAVLTVLATVCFPTGFFFFAPFNESLFLALVLGTFWFMPLERWWLAEAFGSLAALARAQGVGLVFPLLLAYIRAREVVPWLRRRGGRPPGWATDANERRRCHRGSEPIHSVAGCRPAGVRFGGA